ncbi:MAG: dihydrodipicolinate synthase family protein [Anaerolineae bacterium]|nr:dihydrodipicolinate synthase family protein [Anaerolineae bacterium]
MSTFHGIWPALLTPTTPEGGVGFLILMDLVEHLLQKGVDGFYLCGSTGEGLLLSLEERRQVAERVLAQVRGRVPVIVHVGCPATRDAVALARHACEAGAAGVSSVLPSLGGGSASTYLHYESIAAAARRLPFFPYIFGGQTDAVTLMRELLAGIPNVAGAKYTGPDMFELSQLVRLRGGNWTVFSGMDEQCLFAAMAGAPASIGSTLNLMPGAYREMRRSYEAGEVARALELQMAANRVTEVLHSFGFAGALREAMRLVGFDCGEPRLPHPPLPAEKRGALGEALSRAGLAQMAAL